jgi:hypothetical protein
LKASGIFNADAQSIALTKAKETVFNQMTDDMKSYTEKTYGNLDIWLTTQIEATINTFKTKK